MLTWRNFISTKHILPNGHQRRLKICYGWRIACTILLGCISLYDFKYTYIFKQLKSYYWRTIQDAQTDIQSVSMSLTESAVIQDIGNLDSSVCQIWSKHLELLRRCTSKLIKIQYFQQWHWKYVKVKDEDYYEDLDDMHQHVNYEADILNEWRVVD